MGAGYYVDVAHPPDMGSRSEDDLEEEMVRDVIEGVGNTRVRAGIIGELGCSWPLTPNERKVLRAGARAQAAHRSRDHYSHRPRRALANRDRGLPRRGGGRSLARDPRAHGPHRTPDEDHDRARGSGLLHRLRHLRPGDLGLSLQSLRSPERRAASGPADGADRGGLSSSVCWCRTMSATSTGSSAYGGCGYAHILSTVVPHHMRRKGMTDEHLHAILVENPARVLQLA